MMSTSEFAQPMTVELQGLLADFKSAQAESIRLVAIAHAAFERFDAAMERGEDARGHFETWSKAQGASRAASEKTSNLMLALIDAFTQDEPRPADALANAEKQCPETDLDPRRRRPV